MPTSHGLSYTSFKYSDLQVTSGSIQDASDFTAKASFFLRTLVLRLGLKLLSCTSRCQLHLIFAPTDCAQGIQEVYLESGQLNVLSFSRQVRHFILDERLALWRAEKGTIRLRCPSSQVLPCMHLNGPRTCEWMVYNCGNVNDTWPKSCRLMLSAVK